MHSCKTTELDWLPLPTAMLWLMKVFESTTIAICSAQGNTEMNYP